MSIKLRGQHEADEMTLKNEMPLDDDERLAMPLQEFCKRIGIGRNTGYKAAENREIPTFRVGRKYFISLENVRVLLNPDAGSRVAP